MMLVIQMDDVGDTSGWCWWYKWMMLVIQMDDVGDTSAWCWWYKCMMLMHAAAWCCIVIGYMRVVFYSAGLGTEIPSRFDHWWKNFNNKMVVLYNGNISNWSQHVIEGRDTGEETIRWMKNIDWRCGHHLRQFLILAKGFEMEKLRGNKLPVYARTGEIQ